jgi:hypothetical protein
MAALAVDYNRGVLRKIPQDVRLDLVLGVVARTFTG